MENKLGFWEIVKTLEPRWVMSSMATGAVSILTIIVSNKLDLFLLKVFAGFLGILSILFFILFVIFFSIRLCKFPQEVKKDLSHPITANFFAGIFISSSVIVSVIWNVLAPLNWCLFPQISSKIFYIIALILGLTIPILVPFMLTISENVEPKHAIGIWFLPPVGIFVLVFAGNFMALHGIWTNGILILNIFLLGMAFMLYLLVNSMIYSRLKFYSLPAPEVAPSFVIGLAPVGVSIVAVNTFVEALSKNNVFHWDVSSLRLFAELYTALISGYGIWWFILTILILAYYLIKKSIPYSLGWWAFVFPLAAFGIGFKFLAVDISCAWICSFVTFIWVITLILWLFIFYKTLQGIVTGKAFLRPPVVK